jgi:4-hydroxybenzoate polyprenyltransferase
VFDFAPIRDKFNRDPMTFPFSPRTVHAPMTGHTDTGHTDIVAQGRLLRLLPEAARPYALLMRLDRPIGTWLLLLPCWWGVALAGEGVMPWGLLALFAIGALAMRGAGCVINDLWDRRLDARVERTRMRPLASGAVGVQAALGLLCGLLLIGLAVLVQLPWAAILCGFAVMPLVVLYPLAKRVTWWPQAVLGLTFNWGVLVGALAVAPQFSTPVLLAYAAGVFWTLGYDTIYAYQDVRDDESVGVKSSARALGPRAKLGVGIFYALAYLLLKIALLLKGVTYGSFLLLHLALAHLAWQVIAWKPDDPADCLKRFRSNRDAGLLVFAAYAAAALGW